MQELDEIILAAVDMFPCRAMDKAEFDRWPGALEALLLRGVLFAREKRAPLGHPNDKVCQFDVSLEGLCRDLRKAFELHGGDVSNLSDGLFALGQLAAGESSADYPVYMGAALAASQSNAIAKRIRGRSERHPCILLTPTYPRFSVEQTDYFDNLGIVFASLSQLLKTDRTEPLSFKADALLPVLQKRLGTNTPFLTAGSSVRLVVRRAAQTVNLDGREIILSANGFAVFFRAAEKVHYGEGFLTYSEMLALTNRAGHRDLLREIRDQFESQGLSRDEAFELVKTVHGRGMTVALAHTQIDVGE